MGGLQVGNVYLLDLFQAERHTTGSNFQLTTTIVQDRSVCPNQCFVVQERGYCNPDGSGKCICFEDYDGDDCSCDKGASCPTFAGFKGKDMACGNVASKTRPSRLVTTNAYADMAC